MKVRKTLPGGVIVHVPVKGMPVGDLIIFMLMKRLKTM